MNLSKILSQRVPNLWKVGKGVYNIFNSSAPLSALLKPLIEYKDSISVRLKGYDAFALGLLGVPEISTDIVDLSLEGGVQPLTDMPTDVRIKLDEHAAQVIVAACQQASQFLGAVNSNKFSLSSALGFSYYFDANPNNVTIDGTTVSSLLGAVSGSTYHPILWFTGTEYLLNPYIPATDYTANNRSRKGKRDHLELIQLVCERFGIELAVNDTEFATNIERKKLIPFHRVKIQDRELEDMATAIDKDLILYGAVSDETLEKFLQNGEMKATRNASHSDHWEHLVSILHSIVCSASIQEQISGAITAVTSGNIKDWISNAQSSIIQGSKAVAKVLRGVSNAYVQGGIRGVCLYLINILSVQHGVTDDDGVLQFTDNKALMPREFIAGIVATVASALVSIAVAIVSMISPIFSALFGVIGSVAWSVIGSVKSTYNDTYASLYCPEDDIYEANMLNIAPVGFFQCEYSVTSDDDACVQALSNAGGPILVDVPGGQLLIGPRDIQDDGTITKIGYEFHPYGVVINRNILLSHFGSLIDSDGYASVIPATLWQNRWIEMIRDEVHPWVDFSFKNDPSTGHLTASDDKILCASVCACITIFLMWVTSLHWQANDPSFTFHVTYTVASQLGYRLNGSSINDYNQVIQYGLGFIKGTTPANSIWNKVVSMAIASTSHSFQPIGIYPANGGALMYNISVPNNPPMLKTFLSTVYDIPEAPVNTPVLFMGAPFSLPQRYNYAVLLPKYNASTFWKWVWISVGVTVATAATVASLAVGFKLWRKAKLAKNVAKFNEAQEAYKNAVQGVEYRYNATTHQYDAYTFDTSSAEGKLKIQAAWKEYKHTAFTNNLWANVIGGSRYDVSTFWGESAEPETEEDEQESSSEDGTGTPFTDYLYDSVLPNNESAIDSQGGNPTVTIDLNVLYNAITGCEYPSQSEEQPQ